MNKIGDTFNYGGIFIGMSEVDTKRIEIYFTFDENGVYEK
jgi:hypothetical protein